MLLVVGTLTALAPAAHPDVTVAEVPLVELDGERGFHVPAVYGGDGAGWSVAHLGDVNADGFDDLGIGDTENGEGVAYVVFGTPGLGDSGEVSLGALAGGAGLEIHGHLSGDFMGRSISGAGDVNDDGIDDLVLGARHAQSGGQDLGAAYVVFGSPTLGVASPYLFVDDLDGTDGFALRGPSDDSGFGHAVAAGGDFDGDGVGDLLVGACTMAADGVEAAGIVYVVFGHAGLGAAGDLGVETLAPGEVLELRGAQPVDLLGSSVAFAGDFNGDGRDDVLAGGPGQDASTQPGRAYLVFGRASVPPGGALSLGALTAADGIELAAEAGGDQLGWSVGPAGDVNGDGKADALFGARYHDGGAPDSGAVYLLYGTASSLGPLYPLSLLQPGHGVRIVGEGDSSYLGWSAGSAGDVDRDGLGDVLLGARGFDEEVGTGDGRAYVVFGAALSAAGATVNLAGLGPDQGRVLLAEEAGDKLGSGVSGGGDYNVDGFTDFLVGASDADPGVSGAGQVYVLTDLITSPALEAFPGEISISAGGSQTLCAAAGAEYGGLLYAFLGSASGTDGVSFGEVVLPLTLDWYLSTLLVHPNPAFLPGSFGVLDAGGNAQAQVILPARAVHPSLHGTTFHHAYVVLDAVSGSAPFASPAQPLVLTP